jgi:cation:H+ antiporter
MRNHPDESSENAKIYSIPKSFLFILIGLIGIIFGSNFVVDSASNIATYLGVSERMIALTIIALGTSLPELVTSVSATRKGEYDIAIGNVVGSNLFNIGIVLALPVAVFGGINNVTFNAIDLAILFVSGFLLFIFSLNDRKIDKKEGFILLLVFLLYYSYVILG